MNESLGARIVLAVAEATGTDPTALPPLGESVDPDAIEALFHPRSRFGPGDGRGPVVRFAYAGIEVVVRAGGEVSVESDVAAPETGRDVA